MYQILSVHSQKISAHCALTMRPQSLPLMKNTLLNIPGLSTRPEPITSTLMFFVCLRHDIHKRPPHCNIDSWNDNVMKVEIMQMCKIVQH